VEALPQFKHSAAAVPSTPSSNRNALPPQCGHMNFIVVSIVSRSTAGAARSCAGVGAAWDDAPGVGDSAPMNAPLQSTRQGLFRSGFALANLVRIRAELPAEATPAR
jgi:hypothetical protein